MSLSKLEKDVLVQQEEQASQLRELARAQTVSEEKLIKRTVDEFKDHARFCVKALEDNIWRVQALPPLTPRLPQPCRAFASRGPRHRYYRDRSGLPRGPLQLTMLRGAFVTGVVDENTLVWGQGLVGWYPIRNVNGLLANIRSLDGAERAGRGEKASPVAALSRPAPSRRASAAARHAAGRVCTAR